MSQGDQDFADDLHFEHTKMSLWDHIEELRAHMWRAIVGFLAGLVIGLFVGKPAEGFIAGPVERALVQFYEARDKKVKEKLEKDDPDAIKVNETKDMVVSLKPADVEKLGQALGIKGPMPEMKEPLELSFGYKPLQRALQDSKAVRMVMRPPTLSTMSATEAFIVYIKVSMYCGILLASPWIFYQLWSFVAAGLYPHEKKLVHVYMPVSVVLFLAGVALCEFWVLPMALKYLLSFNEWMDLEPDLRLNEWLTFAILFPLMFGIAFQLPLVMYALHRIGIVNVDVYRNNRRIAYFLIACSYLIIGMSPDAFSMLSLIIPMFALYELGIFMCRFSPPPLLDLGGGADEEEMVEA